MPVDPYRSVRFLSIRAIAEKWYCDGIGVPKELIEAELRRGLINLGRGRDWKFEGLVPEDEMPPLEALPGSEIEVTKDFVRRFAEKQRWPLPSFWFHDESPDRRPPGRPSHNQKLLAELEARAMRGELEQTVTAEARALNDWAVEQDYTRMKVPSVVRIISTTYYELKGQ